MIFSDMGVNPTAWGYSVYEEIVGQTRRPRHPRASRSPPWEKPTATPRSRPCSTGSAPAPVRVLIGSTQKMGTGTNVQKRLVALHHLDAPWKPAEVEQREGRILRQGNDNPEVAIYRYVTEGSFDAYMWQALETKARFIAQVMTGESGVRRAEDIGGQELSYAEVKAIASGNPAVLTLAEADAELQRLSILRKNHADEQFIARRSLRDLPETIARLTQAGGRPGAGPGDARRPCRRPHHRRRAQLHPRGSHGRPRLPPANACPPRCASTRQYPPRGISRAGIRDGAASARRPGSVSWKGRSRATGCFPATPARVRC